MKTKTDFKELNFNEYAFFKGCSTTEAKWEFADHVFPENWEGEEKYLTKTGSSKINKNDTVDYNSLDFTIRSNSILEGKCQLGYLCDFYNKGVPLNTLRKYSENPTFVKALSFTGKNQVISDIINPEQLMKLQKTWLLKNVMMKNTLSDNTVKFIENNNWATSFLVSSDVVDEGFIAESKRLYHERKKK